MTFILIILIGFFVLWVVDPEDKTENSKPTYKPKRKFPRKTTYFRKAGQKRNKTQHK